VHMKRKCVTSFLLAMLLPAISYSSQAQGPLQNAAPYLGGTSWQLVKFRGSDDTTQIPDDKTKYTIAFATDGRVRVRIDWNRGMGSWKSSGPNQLQFSPLALTKVACPGWISL